MYLVPSIQALLEMLCELPKINIYYNVLPFQVLKERMLEPETFLPLDYIQAKPLRERLRDIREPKNVKLLFDVLRFEPAAIHRAVLFVTNNALVCESPEDASRVAYDLDRNKNARYDVRFILRPVLYWAADSMAVDGSRILQYTTAIDRLAL